MIDAICLYVLPFAKVINSNSTLSLELSNCAVLFSKSSSESISFIIYKSDALNIANSVDSTRSKCDPKHRGSASFKHYHVKYKNIKWSIHSFYV